MGKAKIVSLRLDEEDRKLLEKDAKSEQRTISNLLVWCWKQWRSKEKK